MTRSLLAIVLCALTAEVAPAEEAAAPSGSPQSAAYREWQRQHAEWERRYAEWDKRYQKWLEEQSRLDDGFLITVGAGPSPTRINTRFSGGETPGFSEIPPFPEANLRGLGAAMDVRLGWLVENDPYLKDYWFGNDELHDQLYFTMDLLTRSTPAPQFRFAQNDTANNGNYFQPIYTLDLVVGLGMTYLVYPYLTSFSTTVGFGLLGLQGKSQGVRTNIGPALNLRIGQEWKIRENWRSGFAVNYGLVQSINPRHTYVNEQGQTVESYTENYASHLFAIQWINSFTPPKYRRGIPPARPQQYNRGAPAK
jgi:hypothetical protein